MLYLRHHPLRSKSLVPMTDSRSAGYTVLVGISGDLIYTGTPDGVGPIKSGDLITAGIDGIGELEIKVV